jgi:FKBP-type peptidyl-prolyl cis-trans isomerase
MKTSTFPSLLLALTMLVACEGDSETTTEEPVADVAVVDEPAEPELPTTIDAPADVAAAPADATVTESGLAYKVLKAGQGDRPAAQDKVTVHYTGWTTDGEMFDSSLTRGEPTSFPLNRVIAGWTEGLQLMSPGEKTRFWIPVELAYNNAPGKPAGMLVFDVELLEVTPGPRVPEDLGSPGPGAHSIGPGLTLRTVTEGEGESPGVNDTISFHFTVWTEDGELQDSSLSSGRPITTGLDQVDARTPAWARAFEQMKPGETARLWGTAEALTMEGRPPPPTGMVFDLQLTEVVAAPKVPADVAAPPADAKKTASGLAYKVLTKGDGSVKPAATDKVSVHYSGWTTDGKMFDSSVSRGKPSSFGLNRVIAGWTEGLQLMVVGEKTRFWIPVELAYNNAPGKPAGMLVFDVELLSIDTAAAPTPPL